LRKLKIVVFAAALALSQPVFSQSSYRLEPGDAVQIWMAQYADLSREVTLAPDGWLSLPLAGALEADGLTLEELERNLVERLQPFFNDPVSLNVSLVASERHAPSVFVAGDVENPGIYPFRPGMTVLHAMAVAGGIYRTPLIAADLDRSIEIQSVIAIDEKRLAELKVIIARINAQITGKTQITIPLDVQAPTLPGILEREQSLLTMQDGGIRAQRDSLARLQVISDNTTNAIEGQIDNVEKRLASAQERYATVDTLAQRGVMQGSQVREVEDSIMEMQGTLGALQASLASQQAGMLTEQSRVNIVIQDYQVGLVTQLGAAQSEQEALEASLANSRRTMTLYEPEEAVATLSYDIVRSTDDGAASDIEANEQTVIMPGDLVRVRISKPEPGGATSGRWRRGCDGVRRTGPRRHAVS